MLHLGREDLTLDLEVKVVQVERSRPVGLHCNKFNNEVGIKAVYYTGH